MKKTFVITFMILLSLVLISASAYAITGQCNGCHTMHNSQNGTRMADRDEPYRYLLMASCIGCHTGPVATERKNSYGAPIVLGTANPGGQGGTLTLAGGDFYWVSQGNDAAGHNVAGIAGTDGDIGTTPPGWDPGATPGALNDGQIAGGAGSWGQQLTCAGQYGCHGNHSDPNPDAGIFGSHHSNTGLTATKAEDPTTVGGSYRFLGGINGLEHSRWNYEESTTSHNEYFGVNDTSSRDQANTAYIYKRTISYSCAQCHGFFHSRIDDTVDLGSAWLRHPTDVDLPNYGEYASYNPDAGTPPEYSLEAPVGRPSPVYDTASSTVTPGTDIVLCLSCHRAHGSPEDDILRWAYSGMQAGSGTSDTGCFTCHTKKNAD